MDLDGVAVLPSLPLGTGAFSLRSVRHLVVKIVAPHGVPTSVAAVIFGGIIEWEWLAGGSFWRAFASMRLLSPLRPNEPHFSA